MYSVTMDGVNWSFSETSDGWTESNYITDEEYKALVKGKEEGKAIIFVHGEKPHLQNYVDEATQLKIDQMTQYLYATDYVVVKVAEGIATKEEYASVFEGRAKAREFLSKI